jgi:hypothetical protein
MSDGSLTPHNTIYFPHRFDGSRKQRKQVYDTKEKQIISSLWIPALILKAFVILTMRATNPDHIFLYNLIIVILSGPNCKGAQYRIPLACMFRWKKFETGRWVWRRHSKEAACARLD